MNIGVEQERAGHKEMAVEALERARDYALQAPRSWNVLVYAYLSRVYASVGDARRFRQATEVAERLAPFLAAPDEDEEGVFYTLGGVLAERSAGLLQLQRPREVLELQPALVSQIEEEGNIRLDMWLHLDWARASLSLKQVEESVHYGRAFVQKALALRSAQAIDRAQAYVKALLHAGYGPLAQDLPDLLSEDTRKRTNQSQEQEGD